MAELWIWSWCRSYSWTARQNVGIRFPTQIIYCMTQVQQIAAELEKALAEAHGEKQRLEEANAEQAALIPALQESCRIAEGQVNETAFDDIFLEGLQTEVWLAQISLISCCSAFVHACSISKTNRKWGALGASLDKACRMRHVFMAKTICPVLIKC